MEALGSVLAHMDVLVSFAYVSVMAPKPYIRPTMTPCGKCVVLLMYIYQRIHVFSFQVKEMLFWKMLDTHV